MRPERFTPLDPTDASYLLTQVEAFEPDWSLVLPYVPDGARAGWLAVLAYAAEVIGAPGRVSNGMLGRIRLQWWREALDEVYGGTPRRHPVVQALVATAKDRPELKSLLVSICDAMERFLEPGEDTSIEDAVSTRHSVYGPLAEALGILAGCRSGGEALALAALSRTAADRDALPAEDGTEPPARRFARALGRNPEFEKALAERITAFRSDRKKGDVALPGLPLRLVRVGPSSVSRIKNPFAQKASLFRGVMTGRL